MVTLYFTVSLLHMLHVLTIVIIVNYVRDNVHPAGCSLKINPRQGDEDLDTKRRGLEQPEGGLFLREQQNNRVNLHYPAYYTATCHISK